MSELAQLRAEVDELRRRLDSLVRFGRVSAASAATARVVFDDEPSDDPETVSPPLPVLQERTKGDRDQRTLAPGEQVVCLFGSGGDAVQGVVLGCHYSDEEPPPLDDPNARVIAGSDIRVGSEAASDAVALAPAVRAAMQTLKDAIGNAVVVAQDGGASLKSTILAALSTWPPATMGATKLKAE